MRRAGNWPAQGRPGQASPPPWWSPPPQRFPSAKPTARNCWAPPRNHLRPPLGRARGLGTGNISGGGARRLAPQRLLSELPRQASLGDGGGGGCCAHHGLVARRGLRLPRPKEEPPQSRNGRSQDGGGATSARPGQGQESAPPPSLASTAGGEAALVELSRRRSLRLRWSLFLPGPARRAPPWATSAFRNVAPARLSGGLGGCGG